MSRAKHDRELIKGVRSYAVFVGVIVFFNCISIVGVFVPRFYEIDRNDLITALPLLMDVVLVLVADFIFIRVMLPIDERIILEQSRLNHAEELLDYVAPQPKSMMRAAMLKHISEMINDNRA